MVRVQPFAAIRPVPERAAEVSSVPYDVVTTDEALYCVLDGEKTQAKGKLVQWRQLLSEIHIVQAKPRPLKQYTGAVDLGRRHNWLYSKKLFREPESKPPSKNTPTDGDTPSWMEARGWSVSY